MKFTNLLQVIHCKKSYYITTPIFYVNSVPHLGHLYTALLSDANARWKLVKQEHDEVFQLTGTDEHGFKIQKKALQENIDCKLYCDNISAKFRSLFDSCNIKYSDYIRTTEHRHKQAVVSFWKLLDNKGFIYKSKYSGWYSVNDECFLNDSEVRDETGQDGKNVKVSIESGHAVEYTSEDNYMFRLSSFKEKLIEYLNNNIIIPNNYKQIVDSQIKNLEDLSISRESKRIHWGIEVPNDPNQIIYVWLDALVNYLTAAGYPNDKEKFKRLWPADVHVVGKDILRFHAIYWPSFLMAADLPLPKRILCHGHWLVNNKKMSKSVGNVIDPLVCIEKYTKEGMRYFLLREGVPDSDCNISEAKFSKFVNQELANTFGNLYQRSISFNKDLTYPSFCEIEAFLTEEDKNFIKKLNEARELCDRHYSEFNFYLGIQVIMSCLRMTNEIVQDYKPWNLLKGNQESDKNIVRKVLFLIYESLRVSAILLQPIVPDITNDLLERLNIDNDSRFYANASVYESKSNQIKHVKTKNSVLFKRV